MGAFDFSVISDDGCRIPIGVAGSVMVNIQGLLYKVGESIISHFMLLQDHIPKEMLSRFTLHIDDMGGSISSSTDLRYDVADGLVKDALSDLLTLLIDIGKDADSGFLKHTDPRHRIPMIEGLASLSGGLGGLDLRCSFEKRSHVFSPSEEYSPNILSENLSYVGEVRGILRSHGGLICLDVGNAMIPIEYDDVLLCTNGIESLIDSPCIVKGCIVFSDEKKMMNIVNVLEIDELPFLSFERMISPDRYLILRRPLIADIDYDDEMGVWTLSNESLGISTSKECLDDAILEFHDHFIFMWEVYDESSSDDSDVDFSDDELELREYIISIVNDDNNQ